MDKKLKLDIYKKIVLSRRLEDRVAELIKAGKVGGFMHPGVGQEALQVAAIATLRPDDYLLYAHRGVAYWVARGIPLEKVLCDLAGREGGTNRGKGGVMRVVYPELGVLGESGTLGGCFPIAAGAGLSIKVKHEDKVVLCFFGDGTSNRGTFHESLNFCAVRKMPVVFLCENNGWAVSMPTERSTAVKDIADRRHGYAMPGKTIDGNDVEQVFDAITEAVKHARSGHGSGPVEQALGRERERQDIAAPAVRRRKRRQKKAERRARSEADHGDEAAAQDHHHRGAPVHAPGGRASIGARRVGHRATGSDQAGTMARRCTGFSTIGRLITAESTPNRIESHQMAS